jgi:hypothetical protein
MRQITGSLRAAAIGPYFAHPGEWMNRFYDLPEDPMSFKGMTYAFIARLSLRGSVCCWETTYCGSSVENQARVLVFACCATAQAHIGSPNVFVED